MKIAIFASAFYPHVGGVEELVRQLAHAYRAAGDEVIVITNRWPQELPASEEYEGIPIYRLAMLVPDGSFKARLKFRLTHDAIRREMIAILRRHEIELLHIQCVSANGFYAMLAGHELSLPLVLTTQGERTMDAGRLYQTSEFMNTILRQLLAEASFITACSQDTLDDMQKYFGTPFGARAQVVYNGINLLDFAAAPGFAHSRPYILGIGRLVPQKGFDVLLEAFARAAISSHDLLLAGEGPERAALEELAARLKISDRVNFLGRADRPTAVSLFMGCSFFVLPSRHEPQGIVNLEAMAAGKAVIASQVGGVPEIVLDGQCGVLVASDDADALSVALKQMCEDESLRERLGTAGRERAAHFDWTAIAAQYQAIYRQVMAPTTATSSVEAPKAALAG